MKIANRVAWGRWRICTWSGAKTPRERERLRLSRSILWIKYELHSGTKLIPELKWKSFRYHVNSHLETTCSSERELRKESTYLWLTYVLHEKISLTSIFSGCFPVRNRAEEINQSLNRLVRLMIFDARCGFFSDRDLYSNEHLCQLLHPPGRAFLRKVLSVLIPNFLNNNNNVSKIFNWSRERFLIYICTERQIYLCDGKIFFTESDWTKLGDN